METKGFPVTEEDRYQLNLMPFIFQEANYDGIRWDKKLGNQHHLEPLFDLDLFVQTNGKSRNELTEAQYGKYVSDCHLFIDRRKQQKN